MELRIRAQIEMSNANLQDSIKLNKPERAKPLNTAEKRLTRKIPKWNIFIIFD
ncbi:MAG: hypothetical protein NVSMB24_09170 [Mucilaginibacter sp.]